MRGEGERRDKDDWVRRMGSGERALNSDINLHLDATSKITSCGAYDKNNWKSDGYTIFSETLTLTSCRYWREEVDVD